MGRVQDKVVLVTGGARGQGRSHAVKLAEEGADVILFDICRDIDTNDYPLATPYDLEEAGLEVEKTGRGPYTAEVDVRDRGALARELAKAIAELGGRLDVVVANAGICPLGADLPVQAFADAFDVDFIGVVNTVHAALAVPEIRRVDHHDRVDRRALISVWAPGGGRRSRQDRAEPVTATPSSWWIPTLRQLAGQLAPTVHSRQRHSPDELQHRRCSTASPMYRQFRPGPAGPDTRGCAVGIPRHAGDADAIRRARGHLECRVLPGLRRVALRDRHASSRSTRGNAEVLDGSRQSR